MCRSTFPFELSMGFSCFGCPTPVMHCPLVFACDCPPLLVDDVKPSGAEVVEATLPVPEDAHSRPSCSENPDSQLSSSESPPCLSWNWTVSSILSASMSLPISRSKIPLASSVVSSSTSSPASSAPAWPMSSPLLQWYYIISCYSKRE